MTQQPTPTPTWWRRNRWALVVLPLVLPVALVASSDLVKPYWFEKGFHDGTVSTTDTVRLVNDYDDGHLRYRGTGRVKLTGWSSFSRAELSAGEPELASSVRLPDGTRAWGLGLQFRAKPTQVLWGCNIGVVGDDGRLYPFDNGSVQSSIVPTNIYGCDPDDAPGPSPKLGSTKLSYPATPRPATWKKYAFGVLPLGVKPRSVRIWWNLPRYFEIPASAAAKRG